MSVLDPEVHYYPVHLSQYFICLMNVPKEFGVVLTKETVEVNAKELLENKSLLRDFPWQFLLWIGSF